MLVQWLKTVVSRICTQSAHYPLSFSFHTCTCLFVEHGERCGVQHTMHGCECVVKRHSCDSHPCHFAHTHHNLCSSLRAIEWFECTMHIACIHLVVTPLVCINQPWWVFLHQQCVVEHLVHVLVVVLVVSPASHHHKGWCGLLL